MSSKLPTLIPVTICAALLSISAIAATAPEHDHSHGQKSTAPASTVTPSTVTPPATTNFTSHEEQMSRMSDLHEKMMAAKTPAERQKLMAENMKLMQEGMDMMKAMQGQPGMDMGMGMMGKGGMAQDDKGGMNMGSCMDMHKPMNQRMDMMEMMMQMMLDQQKAGAMKK